ncbi:MAG: cytochrome C [Calditrichaeota bacterium]|nr:MAG: cytochrome C [Calditrichota bacterium]
MYRGLRYCFAVSLLILTTVVYLWSAGQSGKVAYPEGYRFWTHVKSMVIQEGHSLYQAFGGIHHVYANAKALKALQAHKPFPDGSVFAFDLLEAKAQDHAIVEGSRKVLGVMVKDSKRFSSTGGWGFQAFQGQERKPIVTDTVAQCFQCHQGAKDRDYVFSEFRP